MNITWLKSNRNQYVKNGIVNITASTVNEKVDSTGSDI